MISHVLCPRDPETTLMPKPWSKLKQHRFRCLFPTSFEDPGSSDDCQGFTLLTWHFNHLWCLIIRKVSLGISQGHGLLLFLFWKWPCRMRFLNQAPEVHHKSCFRTLKLSFHMQPASKSNKSRNASQFLFSPRISCVWLYPSCQNTTL